MKHFDKWKIYPTLQEQLEIIKEVDTLQQIQYDELLYLISKKKIPINKIQFYLHTKYSGQPPKQWRKISIQEIIKQYEKLKKDNTQNQWRYSNATSLIKLKTKMAKYQKFQSLGIGQSKSAIRNRIKLVNEMITTSLGNMNVIKQENQYVIQRQKYDLLKQELKYWQQKTKKIQQLDMENSIINSRKVSSNVKLDLFQRIEQKLKVKQQKSLQKYIKYENSQNVDRDAQIQRLHRIFDFYTKKNTKQAKLFEDIIKIHHKLSLQAYLKFIKQFQLNRILSFEQISKIFKKKADAKRQIDLNKFIETFQSIYAQQCIKLRKQFISKQFQQYLMHQVFPSAKLKKILKIVVQKKRVNSICQNLTNRIGQSPQQIIGQYRKRRINLQNQRRNYQNQKYKTNRYKNFRLKTLETERLIRINNDSKQRYENQNSTILNQSPIQANKLEKLQREKGYLSLSSIKNNKVLPNKTLSMIKNKSFHEEQIKQVKKSLDLKSSAVKNPQLKQLRQLVKQQEQDQYLNKYLLPSINKKSNQINKIGLYSKNAYQ